MMMMMMMMMIYCSNQGDKNNASALQFRSSLDELDALLLLLLHLFNGFFSRTTCISRHQKGKPFWILVEQEMMGWQWHQLDRLQIIRTSLQQITTPVPHHSVFTGRMPFLPPNQQRQSTEGKECIMHYAFPVSGWMC